MNDALVIAAAAGGAFIGASVGAFLRGFLLGVHTTGAAHRINRRLRGE